MWLMAAGVKKLTIGGEHTAEQAVHYLTDPQARGDYCSEGGAALMFWLATPRSQTYFGLGEWVSRAKLTALLNGQHPVDGQLIRRPGPDGTMVGGIDVTVSPAPKSVSALWALADDELRRELEELVILAAHRAVGRMLAEVLLLRERYGPGPRDVRHVTATDWVGVEVLHTTARLSERKGVPDPQLHVHNVLIGALDYAGRLRALDSRQILLYRSELDAEASSGLAEELRQRGFTIRRELVRGSSGAVKRVAWEIDGVPDELLQAMSSRRREVEDLRQQYREATGREAEGTGWERFLEQHRGPKAKLTPDEMREAWETEGQSYGFGPAKAARLRDRAEAARNAGIAERGQEGWAAEQLQSEILADLCRDHALLPERDLDKLLVQRSIGLMDPYTAMRVVAKMFGTGDLLATTDGRVTTLEVLAAEQRATAAANELLATPPEPSADREQLERDFKAAEDSGRPFDPLQRRAVELATSGARFVSITGPAGTGKGYASRAMVAAWRRQGRRVVALAVMGRTAQQALVDSGADVAYTLDGLSARIQHGVLDLQPRDVLLVDEAGMVDHNRYAALLQAAAEAEATVVQVGDDRQLASIGPGGLWTLTHDIAAAHDQVAELRVIRRARDPREAQAWTDLREGRVEEALAWYRDERRLRLYETRPDLLAGMIADWWSSNAGGVMLVDSSNAERDQLNRMAQNRRLEAGEIGAEALTLTNGREVRVGDPVLFNAIYHPDADEAELTRERRVENGTPARVLRVDVAASVAVIELDEPAGRRQLSVPTTVPVELGYARHIAKGQGMTADVADVATGPQTAHNQLYTMVTRSREGSRIHALRAELEEMGADLAALDTSPVTHTAQAMTIDEYLHQPDLMGELRAAARQRQIEQASMLEIARRASRSAGKEAIGARTLAPSTTAESRRATGAEVRIERWKEAKPEHKARISRRTSTTRASTQSSHGSAPNSGVAGHKVAARRSDRSRPTVEPLPARSALESVARLHAHDSDIPSVLAFYQVAGRLDIAADPAEQAARRWLADQDAVIVVQNQDQEWRVRAALSEIRANSDPAAAFRVPDSSPTEVCNPGVPDVMIDTSAQPCILRADSAYEERRERRRVWQKQSGVSCGHIVEPDVVKRAYALAPSIGSGGAAYDGMTRAISVAAETHLITHEPDVWTAAHCRVEARRLEASIAVRARAEQVRQAALSADLHRTPALDAHHETAHRASREAELV